jgi:hypothetical protein
MLPRPYSVLGLPELRIVDKIPGPHPMARFVASSYPQQIEFSRTECCRLLSHEALLYVVCHELGHWYRTNYVELYVIMGRDSDKGFLILGTSDPEEGFADAFAAFLMGDLNLEAHYPEQHDLLANMLNNFAGELRDFCDRTCGWLVEQLEGGTT